MRHKWLLLLIALLTAVSLAPALVPLNIGRIQLSQGSDVLLWESMLTIERAGHPAVSLPLCLMGWAFCGVLVVVYIALVLRNPHKPGGFEVSSTATSQSSDSTTPPA